MIKRNSFSRTLAPDIRLAGGVYLLIVAILSHTATHRLIADDAAVEQFEREVRPIFIEHCIECHNPDNDSGGLVLENRETLLKGGESGAALVVGQADQSRLIAAVKRQGDLQMPPESELTPQEIRSLEVWINVGAVWPKVEPPLSAAAISQQAQEHWAFQLVVKPDLPKEVDEPWSRNPIDAFVLKKLKEHGLEPARQASARARIRRLAYTLTGLPPNSAAVKEFQEDDSSENYGQLVEQFLQSNEYGEHWARHWLDVARYSDTKGYVYAREERFWPHAWVYRDWVVNAFNNDMPYDRFLLLQLAADQVEDHVEGDLAAMGFLTLGRRFLGVNHLIIDDRIDVVCRGTMGMTIGCARCHDHKYDPIPTSDYYSLYGVFDSSSEVLKRVSAPGTASEAFETELKKRVDALNTELKKAKEESSQRARSRVRDYLIAQTELSKYPPKGFDQIFQKSDLLPSFVWRWERTLDAARRRSDPIFTAWHRFADLEADAYETEAPKVLQELRASSGGINRLIVEQFTEPPKTFRDVINTYADLFEAVRDEADAAGFVGSFEDSDKEAIRRLLYDPDSPTVVPDEGIVHTESFYDSSTTTALWKLQGEVDRHIIRSGEEVPFALSLADQTAPRNAQIFRRGDPTQAGRVVPRHFLTAISTDGAQPFKDGSGRLEFAEHVISPENPLTARVIVNRVWSHHFGQGLVSTPSDFGTRAETPSHPELLDWLAHWFIEEGWSIKKLQRLILTSNTFQQSSRLADSLVAEQAVKIDPDNRLLWRMNSHRLTFEEFRDSLLNVSGDLQLKLGGKPQDLFKAPYPQRRTLYGLVDRQYLPGTLRVFDFANPDLHIPKRSETTVPQQALFYLNHPIVLSEVKSLVEKLSEGPSAERVETLFHHVLQRSPTEQELNEATALINAVETKDTPEVSPTVADWSYGYGTLNEETKQTDGFQLLPHFTGSEWRGGPKWPDGDLGWVQLTAEGGHPGNDRTHAAVRRWTAPQAGKFRINSKLIHQPAAGDGIRAFVVSSRHGLLASTKIHQSTEELNVDDIVVESGDTIDFVVDIGDVLNSDQYLWTAEILQLEDERLVWNSKDDFPKDLVNKLSPWEQLAHVLICTNEFLFVD